ncbi:hypothetical protein AN958_02825 [Leucoagaricus sp. SymC.cos]|nr:hypothetical protein AN958_02825 [Leucoagaricus sp. SymC.cos]
MASSRLIIRAVKRSQAHYNGIPKLDLKRKKREMQMLMMMLSKDDKVAFTRERSNREEILREAVHSISSWLNRIWLMVYEYKANFALAHECLLYAIKSMTILEESPGIGDCKCLFNNMYVTISLKDRRNRTVKYFSFTGPRNLDQVCMWIWRDLFISMLVDDRRSKTRVKEMLADIEELMGWSDDYDDDDDDADSEDEETLLRDYEGVGTDDEYEVDSEGESQSCCRFHTKYWSNDMNEGRITFRSIVKARLVEIFREVPDGSLFCAIISISQDPTSRTNKLLLDILGDVAGDSADTLKAALTIHTNLYHPRTILKLLEDYYHYLRPIDCPTLLPAVAVLAESSYRSHALKFVERELFDAVQHIFVAVRSAFSHFLEEVNQAELVDILKLESDSSLRASRIERWVDRALTPASSEPMGPMAFAAMMMGFPVGPPPASMDETDLLAYMDLSKPDPDLDPLREEFKPQLKPRFESWQLFAQTMAKDFPQIMHRVYNKIIELMPFFKGADVVKEMSNRIADRPSKGHIHEAMNCVTAFCKAYRDKYIERRRKKKTAHKTTTGGHGIPPHYPSASTGGSNSGSSTAPTPSSNPTPEPSSNSTSTAAPSNLPHPPHPPHPPQGPIIHFFGPHGPGPGGMPFASFFGNPLPHPLVPNNQNQNQNTPPVATPAPASQQPQPQLQTQSESQPQSQPQPQPLPPNFGNGPLHFSPMPPPQECNHQ